MQNGRQDQMVYGVHLYSIHTSNLTQQQPSYAIFAGQTPLFNGLQGGREGDDGCEHGITTMSWQCIEKLEQPPLNSDPLTHP